MKIIDNLIFLDENSFHEVINIEKINYLSIEKSKDESGRLFCTLVFHCSNRSRYIIVMSNMGELGLRLNLILENFPYIKGMDDFYVNIKNIYNIFPMSDFYKNNVYHPAIEFSDNIILEIKNEEFDSSQEVSEWLFEQVKEEK